jgi:hypothetical protein
MISKEQFKEGQIYWTCVPSSEAEQCGAREYNWPYKVKCIIHSSGRLWAHCFNEETGKIDYDSNSSNVVTLDDLYSSHQEANIMYASYSVELSNIKIQEANDLLKIAQKISDNVNANEYD